MKKNSKTKPNTETLFRTSFFPSFYFDFCYKTPLLLETCVSYSATYTHHHQELRFYSTAWNDSSRTIFTSGGEKVEGKRAERCYARCKQPKDSTIKCNACFIEPTSIIGFEGNDAWKLFCDHATFEEIVMPTDRTIFDKPRYDLRIDIDPLPRYPCTGWLMDEKKVCKRETCPDEINEAPLSMCQYYREYAKKWLEATRDNQEYFICRLEKDRGFSEAMTNFMRVLHAARWHHDKKERETARNLLLDDLIPGHAEHKTGILPHYKFLVPMRELLVRLASHLSRKVKDEYLQGEDLNNNDVYTELLNWAKENDLRIFNIGSVSKTDIMKLVKTPAEYANTFMARHFHISVRTLKMSLKESTSNLTRLH